MNNICLHHGEVQVTLCTFLGVRRVLCDTVSERIRTSATDGVTFRIVRGHLPARTRVILSNMYCSVFAGFLGFFGISRYRYIGSVSRARLENPKKRPFIRGSFVWRRTGRGGVKMMMPAPNTKCRSWHHVSAHPPSCDGTHVAPCSPFPIGNGRLPIQLPTLSTLHCLPTHWFTGSQTLSGC